jgi:hypothetical protein
VTAPLNDVDTSAARAAPDAIRGGPRAGDATLAALLRDDKVPWDTLEARYGSLLELVEILLGVVPNCDPYLEIWPPAFRTYNIMVPNFLNLPAPIFGVGGAPGPVVGWGCTWRAAPPSARTAQRTLARSRCAAARRRSRWREHSSPTARHSAVVSWRRSPWHDRLHGSRAS